MAQRIRAIFVNLGSYYKILKIIKIGKMAITLPFLVKMAPDFTLQLSLPKIWNFFFGPKNVDAKPNRWQPFCILAKISFFQLWRPWLSWSTFQTQKWFQK